MSAGHDEEPNAPHDADGGIDGAAVGAEERVWTRINAVSPKVVL